jgi:hypothetical protein
MFIGLRESCLISTVVVRIGFPCTRIVRTGTVCSASRCKTANLTVPASKLAAIQAATLGSCDAKDGVVDGVAEDPRRCHFDAASLACPAGTDGPSCLTPPQVTAVRKIMSGPRNPRTGQSIQTFERLHADRQHGHAATRTSSHKA